MAHSTSMTTPTSYSTYSQFSEQNPEICQNDSKPDFGYKLSKIQTEILVVIDAQTQEAEKLIKGVITGSKAILIDSNTDGVEQITNALQENSNISEIQIISHGSPGCLQLGNSELSLETLNRYANSLQTWSVNTLLLYGCNVAAGDAGVEFIEKLREITGAKIAASANKTGHSALGGDWNLEVKTEEFEVFLALSLDAIANYNFTFPRPADIREAEDLLINDNETEDLTPTTIIAPNPNQNGTPVTYNFGQSELVEIVSFLDRDTGEDYEYVKRGVTEFVLRRNEQVPGIPDNRQIVWYEREDNSTNPVNLAPNFSGEITDTGFSTSMENALFSDLINRGTDNIFTNDGNEQGNNNNIERVDYINTEEEGIPVDPTDDLNTIGFVIMERGGNDPVNVAAITALDANGDPSEFGPLITVVEDDWGISNFEYSVAVLRQDQGEQEIALTFPRGTQGIGGIFVSYEELLGPDFTGNNFFGYSLFPGDVNETNNLVDFTTFPTDTTEDNGGGLDLVGGSYIYQLASLNIAPVAEDDTATTVVGTPVTINVLANDSDEEGDTLTITSTFDQPTENGGTITLENGQLTYTPAAGFTGEDTFEYTIDDGNGGTDIATVTVTVNAPATTTVSGTIFTDTNGDNTLNSPDESGLADINVNLLNADGTVFATVTTDANGNYQFENIVAGNYTVSVDTADTDIPTGSTLETPTQAVEVIDSAIANINFGFDPAPPATTTVSGTIFTDTNSDNTLNSPDESGLADINVNLLNADGTVFATVTTDANGNYQFENIVAGNYTVSVDTADTDIPTGSTLETPTQAVEVTDSAIANINFGFDPAPPATTTVSGTIFTDTNSDDTLNSPDESGLANINVNLLNADGTVFATVTTDANGNYQFENIVAGNYTVSVDTADTDIPTGSTLETPTQAVEVTDSAIANINFGFDPANTSPDAVNDQGSTRSNTAIIINVVGNDSDPENDPLEITTFDQTTTNGGTITRSASGEALLYTPGENYVGTDTFTYTISDGKGGTDTATVTINVETDQTLIAANDTATTDQDKNVTINVLANDVDPENDPLTIGTFDGTSANGGTIAPSQNGQALVYTPAAGFSGTDTFTYQASDGTNTATATVTVTVNPPTNTEPAAIDDERRTDLNTPVTVNVLDNDTDPDNDPLNIESFDATSANGGRIQPTEDNRALVYTPADGFVGTDTFTYSINDGNGGSDIATVTINVIDEQLEPEAVDDRATTQQDTEVDIDVLSNDTDPDGDQLSVNSFDQTSANGGTIAASEDGQSLVYTPASGFIGVDTFIYQVSDGTNTDIATVTVTVEPPVNSNPDAVNDQRSIRSNTAIIINVVGNDSDPENDPLEITTFDQTTTNGGTITRSSSGEALLYTPAENFVGTDSFTYTISDGNGGTDTATVTINVETDQTLIAENDRAITEQDTNVSINVLANDVDPEDDPLQISTFDATSVSGGTIARSENGQALVYTPAEGFVGTDTFTYQASDGTNTDIATVTVIVNPPTNTEPAAIDDERRTLPDTAVTVNVLNNDTDPENDPLNIESFDATSANGGTIEPSEDNRALVYTPADGFVGTDTFTYSINDGNGGSDIATVTINVIEQQLRPEAVDDSAITEQDTEVGIDVLVNDLDPENDELSVNSFDETSANGGTVAASEDGQSLVYTPAEGFTGIDTFTYQVSDGTNTDLATVTVTVEPPANLPPIATNEDVNTAFETPLTFDLSDNITDPNENQDLSTIDLDPTTPEIDRQLTLEQGTLTVNEQGQVTFTPVDGFIGVVTIPYTVADDLGATSQQANISITVNANQPPTAENVQNDPILNSSAAIPLPLTAGDFSDPDGTVELINFTLPDLAQGTLLLNGQTVTDPVQVQRLTPDQLESLTFVPNRGFAGNARFTYTVTDNNGATSDEATITIPVAPLSVPSFPETPSEPSEPAANLPPVAEDQTGTVPNDGTRFPVPQLRANDDDGNINFYTITELPANGILFLNGEEVTNLEQVQRLTPEQAGQLTFEPDPNFTGEISFSFTATDDDNAVSNVGTVRLTVEDGGSIPGPEPINDGGCDCPPIPDFGTVVLPQRLDLAPTAFDEFDPIEGTEIGDTLAGSPGSDVVFAFGGDDSIEAFEGNDTVFGGIGNDLTFGDQGNDSLLGADGNDTLIGSNGGNGLAASSAVEENDTIHGHRNDDLLQGGPGDDLMYSGQEDDFSYGGKGNDIVWGDLGNDTLHGDEGNDTLVGDTVDESEIEPERGVNGMIDLVWGGAGDDFINGGRGNDTLSGGVGNDTVRGGKEDDLIYGEAGSDLMYGDLGNDQLCGGDGNDSLYGDINNQESIGDAPGRDTICGGNGNDILFGNEDQDRLCGGTDNDTLYGGLAEDTLAGEQGDDWLFGDQGDDLISGGSGSDRFILLSGSGTDTIQDFQLGTDFIALGGGLSFDGLTLSQSGTSTVISLDGQELAILNQIQVSSITESSFTTFAG